MLNNIIDKIECEEYITLESNYYTFYEENEEMTLKLEDENEQTESVNE